MHTKSKIIKFVDSRVVKKYQKKYSGWTLGIDATNLRQGGGVTHLLEFLHASEPKNYGISKVVVWGGARTLAALNDFPWLVKIQPKQLDKGLFFRTFWQRFRLSKEAQKVGCDLLFVPGGSYAGEFKPFVTLSQNLLPFELKELLRYGFSLKAIKLLLLRWTQSKTFRTANGVIFLTKYAKNTVLDVTGKIFGESIIIPHGLSNHFLNLPKIQRPILEYSDEKPFHMLYVSIIDQYKHQWNVIEAVARLRAKTGYPIIIDLVGPAYPPALRRMNYTVNRLDPQGIWVRYHGAIPYLELHKKYAEADLGIFASSCENMPITLMETMAAGLPIACSNRGPMSEILGDAGVYFDPESIDEIYGALNDLINSIDLRTKLAEASFKNVKAYSWKNCAKETLSFLEKIVLESKSQ